MPAAAKTGNAVGNAGLLDRLDLQGLEAALLAEVVAAQRGELDGATEAAPARLRRSRRHRPHDRNADVGIDQVEEVRALGIVAASEHVLRRARRRLHAV